MSVLEKILKTQEFATLPTVAAKILTMLSKDDIDTSEVSRIVEADPSLTMKLLRVANSPLYASRNEVTSINQAIMALGFNRLTNIVLGVSIFSKFLIGSQQQIAESMQQFWWHASCTGVVAKDITNKIQKNFKEMEFIGGLLHDIGKLALLQFDSKKYLEVIALSEEKQIKDWEAENEVFGVSHLEVGKAIAEQWKLPQELIECIEFHSHPSLAPKHSALVSIIRVADLLCEMWGAGFHEGYLQIQLEKDESWANLCAIYPDLTNLDFEELTFELEKEFEKSSQFLNIISH